MYGALSRAIKERRQHDPKARDATAQDVEAEIRPADPGLRARPGGRSMCSPARTSSRQRQGPTTSSTPFANRVGRR